MADSSRTTGKFDSIRERINFLIEQYKHSKLSNANVLILLIVVFLIQGGVLYVLSENVPIVGDKFTLIFSSRNPELNPFDGIQNQFGAEIFLVSIILAITMAGFYLVTRATTYIDDAERSAFIQIMGIGLITLGVVLIILLMSFKLYGNAGKINIF